MTDEEIGVRLSLKDRLRFSAEARAAADSIDNIGDQARQSSVSLKVMGGIARGVGRTAFLGLKYGALGAAAAIGAIGVSSVRASIEAADVAAKTRGVIKGMGYESSITRGDVAKLSESIMGYTGVSDEALESSGAVLLTFKRIGQTADDANGVFERTMRILPGMSKVLGTDVTSAAMTLGKALQDPAEKAAQLGRTGTVTAGQVEKLQKMAEAGAPIWKQQAFLLKALEKQFGQVSKTMGKVGSGPFNILKEKVGNALEDIGKTLLPVMQKALPGLTKTLVSTLKAVGPAIAKVANALGKTIGPLMKALTPAINAVADVFVQLAKAAAPVITLLARTFGQVLRQLMPALKPFIAALGDALLQALKAIAPSLPSIARSLARILVALTPLIPPLTKLIVLLLKIAGPVVAKVLEAFAWIIEKIQPLIEWVGDLGSKFAGVFDRIKRIASDVWNWMVEKVQWVIDKVKALIDWIDKAIDKLAGLLSDVTGKFADLNPLGTDRAADTLGQWVQEQTGGSGGGHRGGNTGGGVAGPRVMVPRAIPALAGVPVGPRRPLVAIVQLDRREVGRAFIDDIDDRMADH